MGILYIVIIVASILLIFFVVSYIMCLGKDSDKYKNEIIEKGYEVQAEVMGYVYISFGRGTMKCPILKFKDIYNNEQIVIETVQTLDVFIFDVGDVITIKYIEQQELDSENVVKSKFLNMLYNRNTVCVYDGFDKKIGEIDSTENRKNLIENSKKFFISILDRPKKADKGLLSFFIFAGLCILYAFIMIIKIIIEEFIKT